MGITTNYCRGAKSSATKNRIIDNQVYSTGPSIFSFDKCQIGYRSIFNAKRDGNRISKTIKSIIGI